jgi:hypothetical protein
MMPTVKYSFFAIDTSLNRRIRLLRVGGVSSIASTTWLAESASEIEAGSWDIDIAPMLLCGVADQVRSVAQLVMCGALKA